MPFRPSYANVASTLALFAALGGTAIASTGGGSSTPAEPAQATTAITACSAKKGTKKGLLRIAKVCKKSETKLTWNVVGPAGATGPAGPQGPAGSLGSDGASGTSAFVPAGAVMHFDLASCPSGWAPYTEAVGRYLVGTGAGGTNGTSVGAALTPGENRTVGRHSHAVADPGHTHTATAGNTIVAGNVPFVRFQSNGSGAAGSQGTLTTQTAATGITVEPTGGFTGTNAPYVNLLACKKG